MTATLTSSSYIQTLSQSVGFSRKSEENNQPEKKIESLYFISVCTGLALC